MEVTFFDSDIEQCIIAQGPYVIAKAGMVIELLRQHGSRLKLPYSRSLGRGLFELRVRSNVEVRLLYMFHGRARAVLLHGFVKKSEAIPKRELDKAMARKRFFD